MPETNKRAVAFDDFAKASKYIATKAEVEAVNKRIDGLPQEGGSVEFASTEEILALFQDSGQSENLGGDPDTSGE